MRPVINPEKKMQCQRQCAQVLSCLGKATRRSNDELRQWGLCYLFATR